MSYHYTALTKLQKLRQDLRDQLCPMHHAVIDPSQLFDLIRDWSLRIHKDTVTVHNGLINHLDRTDLDNLIILGSDACGLQIKHYKRRT